MKLYRHGDVLVASITSLPEGAEQRKGVTLAYGEVTGHSHRIANPDHAETFIHDGQLYLHVKTDSADLIHEEHNTIALPKGVYRVWQQREYEPDTNLGWRTVYD